jgi:hypothetical protein
MDTKRKYGLTIGVRVTSEQEARLAQFQRQLAARNPDARITKSRAATVLLREALDATMPETKATTD